MELRTGGLLVGLLDVAESLALRTLRSSIWMISEQPEYTTVKAFGKTHRNRRLRRDSCAHCPANLLNELFR